MGRSRAVRGSVPGRSIATSLQGSPVQGDDRGPDRAFHRYRKGLGRCRRPRSGLLRFLSSVVRLASQNKALCDALEEAGAGRFEPSPGVGQSFDEALEVLLRRAQEAGAVRQDVGIADLRALLVGCLSMERAVSGAGSGDAAPGRMAALMCDALRTERAVTELNAGPVKRNESRCGACGAEFAAARTGRPARYCGGACRQKAHRARESTRRT